MPFPQPQTRSPLGGRAARAERTGNYGYLSPTEKNQLGSLGAFQQGQQQQRNISMQIGMMQAANAPQVNAFNNFASALRSLFGGFGGGGGGGGAGGPSYEDTKTLGDLQMAQALLRAKLNNDQAGFLQRNRDLDSRELNEMLSYLTGQEGFAGRSRDLGMLTQDNKSAATKNEYLQQLDTYNSDAVTSGAYNSAGRNRTRGRMATDQGLAQALIDLERQGITLTYDQDMAQIGKQRTDAKTGYDRATVGRDQQANEIWTTGQIRAKEAEEQGQRNKMALAGLSPGK